MCVLRQAEPHGARAALYHQHGRSVGTQSGPNRGPRPALPAARGRPAHHRRLPQTAHQTQHGDEGDGVPRWTDSRVSYSLGYLIIVINYSFLNEKFTHSS